MEAKLYGVLVSSITYSWTEEVTSTYGQTSEWKENHRRDFSRLHHHLFNNLDQTEFWKRENDRVSSGQWDATQQIWKITSWSPPG
jgi:hypothetical protein